MIWIFGYGSLVWRPNFDFIERQHAKISGWSRRFYQGSPDHRGTPEHLGRVVTLMPTPGEECYGVAFAIDSDKRDEIFNYLDIREQGGYDLLETEIQLLDRERVRGYLYTANSDNPFYLGSASVEDMAAQIVKSRGPSGPNLEYFMKLYDALSSFAPSEPHLTELHQEISKSIALDHRP